MRATIRLATVLATLGACAPPPGEAAAGMECADAPPEGAHAEGNDEECAYFVTFEGEEANGLGRGLSAPARRLVFLNREGGLFRAGKNHSGENSSTLVTGATLVPPYPGSDDDWRELKGCVEERFARFDLDLVDSDPGDVPHIEAVVGGHPCLLGLGARVRGVAPLANDCSVVERAVVYAFAHAIPDVTTACEVTAHEIGHALGLDHEYLCGDPMTYLSCGYRSFQDVEARCGTSSPRDCTCTGRQNSARHLFTALGARAGADDEPPVVRVLSPRGGAALPGGGRLDIVALARDDERVAAVKLVWENEGELTVDCAAPKGGVSCTADDERYRFTLEVGHGSRRFRVQAVDDSGNSSTTAWQSLTLAR